MVISYAYQIYGLKAFLKKLDLKGSMEKKYGFVPCILILEVFFVKKKVSRDEVFRFHYLTRPHSQHITLLNNRWDSTLESIESPDDPTFSFC